ncbi:unnamed protein product [Cyprideis torosa]|uniref:2-(3-amino-3-carboxypropyl)histidine synthase subunit 1 n=1 Tax=Cyprideis torosa TaxID=163714 RepID=A0A7R8WM89_9CRUS|nr:unnamed protein product [Cyprideis torosa]CAG0905103.1 unnamed protein product [Cyprideis torosa]
MKDLALVVEETIPAREKRAISRKTNKIPDHIKEDEKLQGAMKHLPSNYNFEIPKTVWRIQEAKAECVALQMPEGLLLFATTISDIIQEFTGADTVIMGDVTYGACCVDDFTAEALGADFLVHYGHSCLIPVNQTSIPCLYVFVDIQIDLPYLVEVVKANIPRERGFALVSTIQFLPSIHALKQRLLEVEGYSRIRIPQCHPLSPGEILGCSAPRLDPSDVDLLVYVGDGRFHLEAAMIANPEIAAYKYDPYTCDLTEETYDHVAMRQTRGAAISRASEAEVFGLVLGTLGRQGSPKVLQTLEAQLKGQRRSTVTYLMSEIFPSKLQLVPKVQAWVQIACPRLSIDWGTAFARYVKGLCSYRNRA